MKVLFPCSIYPVILNAAFGFDDIFRMTQKLDKI